MWQDHIGQAHFKTVQNRPLITTGTRLSSAVFGPKIRACIIPPAVQDDARPLIVLDELHKAKFWKKNLKGVYDTLDMPCDILVTGSARLNIYRKGSDSLLGRYYHLRLHPFSMHEMLRRKPGIAAPDLVHAVFERSIKISAESQGLPAFVASVWTVSRAFVGRNG